jgi:hypothetical protein
MEFLLADMDRAIEKYSVVISKGFRGILGR